MSTPSILKTHGNSSKTKKVSFGIQVATKQSSSSRVDEMPKSSSKSRKNSKRCASSRDILCHSSTNETDADVVEEEYEVEAILDHKKVINIILCMAGVYEEVKKLP